MNNYYNIYNININPILCPSSRYTILGNIYIFLCLLFLDNRLLNITLINTKYKIKKY